MEFVDLPVVVVLGNDILLHIHSLKVALEGELVEADDRGIILAVK